MRIKKNLCIARIGEFLLISFSKNFFFTNVDDVDDDDDGDHERESRIQSG